MYAQCSSNECCSINTASTTNIERLHIQQLNVTLSSISREKFNSMDANDNHTSPPPSNEFWQEDDDDDRPQMKRAKVREHLFWKLI